MESQAAIDMTRHRDIETRAYYLWKHAGHPPGDGLEFWLQAERELNSCCFTREHKVFIDGEWTEAVKIGEPSKLKKESFWEKIFCVSSKKCPD